MFEKIRATLRGKKRATRFSRLASVLYAACAMLFVVPLVLPPAQPSASESVRATAAPDSAALAALSTAAADNAAPAAPAASSPASLHVLPQAAADVASDTTVTTEQWAAVAAVEPAEHGQAAATATGAAGMRAASASSKKALPAPANVRAERYGNAFLVTWDPVRDARVTGYNLYRGYCRWPFLFLCRRVNTSPITCCSFLDVTVSDFCRPQYYWVTAVAGACMESAPGGPACIDPRVPDTSPPLPPWGLQAAVPGKGVSLTWSGYNVEPDFSGYNLYRVEGGGAVRLNDNPLRDFFLYFPDGAPGETYEVRSVDSSGNESAGARAEAFLLAEEVLEFVDPACNNDPRVTYEGFWKAEGYPWAHGGQIVVSAVETGVAGSGERVAVRVVFEGRSVELYCALYWQCGWCEVFLDGVSQGRLNLSIDSDYPEPQYLLYAVYSLRPGRHVLEVVNLGIPGPELPEPDVFPYGIVNVDYLVIR